MLNGEYRYIQMRLAIDIMKGVDEDKAYMEVKLGLRSVRRHRRMESHRLCINMPARVQK